jgi:hypothetical protein
MQREESCNSSNAQCIPFSSKQNGMVNDRALHLVHCIDQDPKDLCPVSLDHDLHTYIES